MDTTPSNYYHATICNCKICCPVNTTEECCVFIDCSNATPLEQESEQAETSKVDKRKSHKIKHAITNKKPTRFFTDSKR